MGISIQVGHIIHILQVINTAARLVRAHLDFFTAVASGVSFVHPPDTELDRKSLGTDVLLAHNVHCSLGAFSELRKTVTKAD